MVWYDMVWYGMVWYGMVWHGMEWSGIEQHDTAWYGILCDKPLHYKHHDYARSKLLIYTATQNIKVWGPLWRWVKPKILRKARSRREIRAVQLKVSFLLVVRPTGH